MPDDILIHTRAEWGAAAATQDFERHDALGIVLHNMQNANRPPEASPADEFAMACAISRRCQHEHMHDRGWSDIGQNFTISRGGVILEGRKGSLEAARAGQVARGAHASGVAHYNQHYHGIELEGDFRQSYAITDVQRTALVNLCAHLCRWAGNPALEIIPHYDVDPGHTDCPGVLRAHIDEIRAAVQQRIQALGA